MSNGFKEFATSVHCPCSVQRRQARQGINLLSNILVGVHLRLKHLEMYRSPLVVTKRLPGHAVAAPLCVHAKCR